jgi:hypothetical protein
MDVIQEQSDYQAFDDTHTQTRGITLTQSTASSIQPNGLCARFQTVPVDKSEQYMKKASADVAPATGSNSSTCLVDGSKRGQAHFCTTLHFTTSNKKQRATTTYP